MRTVLACALAAAALPAAAAPGAAAEPAWVLSASGSASASVVLRRSVELALVAGTAGFDEQRRRNTVVQHAGGYGGLVLRDAEGRVVYSVVAVRGLPGAFPTDTSPEAGRQVLPAGSYRVDVVGDGRVTVRLPVRGQVPPAVTATRRTDGVQAGTVTASGSQPLTQLRLPFASRPAAPVLHVGETRAEGHLAAMHTVCFLRPQGRLCATDAEASSASVVFGPGDDGTASSWGVTTLLAPGQHQAALDLPGVAGAREAALFVVALPA